MPLMTRMPLEVVKLLQHVACEMREDAHGNAHLRLSEAACVAACGASVQRSAAEGTWPGARVHLVRPCALYVA